MEFNSDIFLFVFLPLFGFAAAIVRRKRVYIILVASLAFYLSVGIVPFLILALAVLWSFFWALQMERFSRGLVLGVGLAIPAAILFGFKYWVPIATRLDIDLLLGPPFEIFAYFLLPVGISFYTFQIAGYLIDVYRKKIEVERSFVQYATFITFFPQLVAGPIIRYDQVRDQLRNFSNARLRRKQVLTGLWFGCIGLTYKVVFSDLLFVFHSPIRNSIEKSQLDALFEVFSYSMIIFFDFWGYSLMALGIACGIGIRIPINFREPYKARNPQDFWRRWHITLSSWLRDYVYIPLGGNKKYIRNILIVFIGCGIWHGAGIAFLAWGALHGIYVVAFFLCRDFWSRLPGFVQTGITFLLVSIAWPLFYSGLGSYLDLMRAFFNVQFSLDTQVPAEGWMLLAAICYWAFGLREDKVIFGANRERQGVFLVAGIAVLSVIAVALLSVRRTFIYFQF